MRNQGILESSSVALDVHTEKLWRCIKLVAGSAPACYGRSLGSNPDIFQKYEMGDINKAGANTL
jgi:hypothetical protein